jgi:TPR repeat protein
MYHHGMGVTRDYAQALDWYRKAAAQGLAEAESNVGVIYEDGLGVEKDYPKAAALYRDAATHGATRGEFNLAVLYSSGRGVPLDYVTAYLWFSRAASAGEPMATRSLKNLETVMTPHQKEQAQARLADGQDASLSETQPHPPFDAGTMSQR